MTRRLFHGVDAEGIFGIRQKTGCGVSMALAADGRTETFCAGSGRFGQDFPVNPDMLFQAGSVSKPAFAAALLRFADKGVISLDADISGVVPEYVRFPLTFSALLSHTAGFNLHGFPGYRAGSAPLSLEDVLSGNGNTPKLRRIRPYGKQYRYSGGGITLAELAFTRMTGLSLRDAFMQEIAAPLELTRTGFFQPLDAGLIGNAAFGGRLGEKEDPEHGYHYYPEHAAAGLWTTPSELVKLGLALSRSFRAGGLLRKKTAERMMTPVLENCGLCMFRRSDMPGLAFHGGWNEGFLTVWKVSLTEDRCAAVMINRSSRPTARKLEETGMALYQSAGA